jgi:cytochrome b
MNTRSASRADAQPQAAVPRRVLVWDAPVRVFHWLMVLCFFGAYASAESERWRLLHVTLGYTMIGLVGFRVVWGLIGTRHARFASFVRGPTAILRYLRSMTGRDPEHHVGHNPAGALAIVALLGFTLVVATTGWASYNEIGGEWLGELHEGAAEAMMALVVVHIAAVVGASWLHRENLIGAMVNGRKVAAAQDGVKRAWRGVAALMLAAVLGFWWLQWRDAPSASPAAPAAAVKHERQRD